MQIWIFHRYLQYASLLQKFVTVGTHNLNNIERTFKVEKHIPCTAAFFVLCCKINCLTNMEEIQITVIMGREKWAISIAKNQTFGDLRALVETKANVISGGLRLIHKGKTHSDNVILESISVTSGTKMMAMRTGKQVKDEEDKKRAAKLAADNAAALALKERVGSSVASSVDKSDGEDTKSGAKGDPVTDGSFVLLKKRTDIFRVNIEMEASIGDLKQQVAMIDGINAEPRDIRILGKGRMLTGEKSLKECGISSGSTLMILFNARHHDKQEASVQVTSITKEVNDLQAKTQSVQKKANKRLLNGVEITIARGELVDTVTRLKDNLASVRGDDERIPLLEKQLNEIEELIQNIVQE